MISFIIPAYNEEDLLGPTIDAIHLAAKRVGIPYEVVVVDDFSDDATFDVAEKHKARAVRVNKRQISATRNAGAKEAHGDVFIFVDADTIVSTFLVSETVNELLDGAVGGGAVFEFDGMVPLYGKILQSLVNRLYRLGRVASGSYLFCTREAFEQAGGFDETLYASEEAVMSRALKKCGRFVILRKRVLTSGRKLRLHSFWQIFGVILRVALSGGKVKNKKTARIWYDAKREKSDGA